MSSSRPTNVVSASGSAAFGCATGGRESAAVTSGRSCATASGESSDASWRTIFASRRANAGDGSSPSSLPSSSRKRLYARNASGCRPHRYNAEHLLRPEPLPQRPIRDAPVQHVDRAGVIAERQSGIHENLERTLAHLVDAGSLGRQRQVVDELGESRTVPPFQGLTDEFSGLRRVRWERRAGFTDSPFEPHGVDIVGVDRQQVATGSGLQRSGATEIAPQSRHVALHRADRTGGWIVAEQDVDEPVDGDDQVAMHEQGREEQAAARTAHGHRVAVVDHLQRPQHSELHARPSRSCRSDSRSQPPCRPPASSLHSGRETLRASARQRRPP